MSYVSGEGNLFLKWGINNCGFGELYVSQNKENEKFVFSSEYMSRESVKAILCKMIDDGIFSDFEEEIKVVTQYGSEEAHALAPFGEKDSMYFTVPFYMDLDKEDASLIEMRFHGKGTSVIALWVKAENVYEINSTMLKKYHEERVQFSIEKGFEIDPQPSEVVKGIEGVDLFCYGEEVRNKGWQGALVNAEKWEWQIREKPERK